MYMYLRIKRFVWTLVKKKVLPLNATEKINKKSMLVFKLRLFCDASENQLYRV